MSASAKEYLALVEKVAEHDRHYHVLDSPIISDLEYDKLVSRLREMEKAHPDWIVRWSPTQRVGAAPASAQALRYLTANAQALQNW